jgi:hypothetical protein
MINQDTPTRILELGRTLWSASQELEKIFRDLSAEADGHLVTAAAAFLEAQKDPRPAYGPYMKVRRELTPAAVAASSIKEAVGQTTLLHASCTYWSNIADSTAYHKGRFYDQITMVCNRVAAAARSK